MKRRANTALAGLALLLTFAAGPVLAGDVPDLSQAKRIVAIGGSVTEIVYALGEEKRLVARDSTSIAPQAALDLPDIGYMRALSPEGVLSVDPDGIVMLEGSGPPEAVQVLKKASVPVASVPESFDRDGILAKIDIIGKALGVEDKAKALASTVDADLRAAVDAAKAQADPARVLFILSMQGGRVMASGTGTAANGIIEMAGMKNAVTGYSGYKQLTDEAVIEAAPEVILMMKRGAGPDSASDEALLANAALAATPAGKARHIVRMDGAYLLGPKPSR